MAPQRRHQKPVVPAEEISPEEESLRVGEAVRILREKRGFRQSELAGLAGLAASQISAVENGRRQPSIATLRRICQALGTTLADLMRRATGSVGDAEDPVSSGMLPGMEELFQSPEDRLFAPLTRRGICRTTRFDSYATPLPSEDSVREIERRLTDYLRLETICGAFRRASVPLSLPFRADADGAEQLAGQVRGLLGLGDSIVLDYVSVFENHGIRVVFLPLPRLLESLSFYDMESASAFIVVNEECTVARQLFRLALELAYIYLFTHNGNRPVPESAEANRRFAKLFAACFLLPRASVLAAAASLGAGRGDWSYGLVLRVKRHFGVSAEAFCYRLLELGLLDDTALAGLLTLIRGHYAAHLNQEPGEALPALVRNGRLTDLLERARILPGVYDEVQAIARHAGITLQ